MTINSFRETAVPSRTARIKVVALVVVLGFFVLVSYTFLHEAGHALVGLAFGQTLTEFNLNFWDLSAHVSMQGDLTAAQRALQSVAGVGLPLVVWALFIGLAPRRANLSLEMLKLVSAMAVVNTLLAWIIIPLLDLFGRAPVGDDVTHFLRASQMPPLLLTAVAFSLYALGWALYQARTEGLRHVIARISQADTAEIMAGTRPLLGVLAALLALALVVVLVANSAAPNGSYSSMPPAEFQPAAVVDLSSRAYEAETLARITLEEAGTLGVYFLVQNIDTNYFDLSLSGPDGYRALVLHGEDFRTDSLGASGLQEFALRAGEYQLILTARQNPGLLSVSWGVQ